MTCFRQENHQFNQTLTNITEELTKKIPGLSNLGSPETSSQIVENLAASGGHFAVFSPHKSCRQIGKRAYKQLQRLAFRRSLARRWCV